MAQTLNDLSIKTGSELARQSILIGVSLIAVMAVQITYFYLQNSQAESAKRTIHALLRQEVTANNLFLLSRALIDLQDTGLVSCVGLKQPDANQSYLDTKNENDCPNKNGSGSGFFALQGTYVKTVFQSLNGQPWEIQFRANVDQFFTLSLWLSRLVAISIGILSCGFYFRQMDQKISIINRQNLENFDLDAANQNKAIEIFKMKAELELKTFRVQIAEQVSHDIRSPITAINTAISKLDTIAPLELKKILSTSVTRINAIANDVLANRVSDSADRLIASSNGQLSCAANMQIPLAETIQVVINEKRIVAEALEINATQLKCNLEEAKGVNVRIDSSQLQRILSNLLNNSLEACGADGVINIDVRTYSKQVCILIRDNGRGMPQEVLSRIGERGFSVGKDAVNNGSGSETGSGSGLGLYHARTSIEAVGGRFEINSELGRGTAVSLFLPLV